MANQEIRTILAPLKDGNMLLPSCTVAEILEFKRPKALKQTPSWVLGEMAWHGWQVPVICYEQLLNRSIGNCVTSKSRILVIKTLGESTQINYIGLLIRGLPKLKKVTAATLKEVQAKDLPETQFSRVSIDDEQAFIPKLGCLTRLVEQSAYSSPAA